MAEPTTKKVFTIGLKSLKAGDVLATGLMPDEANLAQHGNVYRNTLDINTTDATFEDYFEEEIDQPVASEVTLGDTNVTFEILRPSIADLLFWAGGTADASGLKWSAPTGYVQNEKALKINSKQGYVIEFPKCQITANITGGGQKSNPMRLKVSANVLVPTNASGVDQTPMNIYEQQA